MRKLAQYRKAIAAAVTPLLALPLVGWISGEVEFSASVLAGAMVAAVSGVLTWRFPNAEA
jgi:ABC-type uncharacterized transport system permease subunit